MPLVPTVFVDSSRPDDTGNGLSAATAKKTIAAAQALLTTGSVLGMARGSSWREQLTIPANSIGLCVYGAGAMPIIDGADVAGVWTQPDGVTYPNVWSQSWSRTSTTTTGEEKLGLWENSARPARFASSLADLQANGGWYADNLTLQTTNVYVKAAADPNSDGVVREITKRHYGINGHFTTVGANRTGCRFEGPLEIKRCVGHYNAFSGALGSLAQRLFLRDGNIHHLTSEGASTTDSLATEVSPQTVNPSPFVAYRVSGTGFTHTFRRCLALFPGGTNRVAVGAFYAHASSPSTIQSLTLEGCISRGATFSGADAARLDISGGYCEDRTVIGYGFVTAAGDVNYLHIHDTVASNLAGGGALRRTSNAFTASVRHTAIYDLKGGAFANVTGGTLPIIENCAFVTANAGVSGGDANIRYSVLWTTAGRPADLITNLSLGDYNVWYSGDNANGPAIRWNGVLYNGTFGTYQAASGIDQNSVFLKPVDQTVGNANAFFLGTAQSTGGPSVGDYRINPSAKVYKGDGSSLIGLFGDGVTPITMAGPQYHYDFNLRTVVAGPPTRIPVLPATVAECRAYIEDPTAWNFYP